MWRRWGLFIPLHEHGFVSSRPGFETKNAVGLVRFRQDGNDSNAPVDFQNGDPENAKSFAEELVDGAVSDNANVAWITDLQHALDKHIHSQINSTELCLLYAA